MELQTTLRNVFEALPEKLFTSAQVKTLVEQKINDTLLQSHFDREFKAFRDSKVLPICKFKQFKKWMYVNSENYLYKFKHNAHLNRVQVKAERRKVQTL